MSKGDTFGEQIPFCEPYWYVQLHTILTCPRYQGGHSPYYHEGHKKFRAVVRKFVEEEIKPNVDKWIKEGYPKELHERAYELGIQGILYPKEFGGTQPDDFDPFYELIMLDEMARMGGGNVLGQAGINSMALPPIMNFGSDYLKKKVCRDVITGKKVIILIMLTK
jgi:acyl-CoA dehydrogenase